MWRNPLFYSTASGRPRVLFRFLGRSHFPEPEGGTSGPFPFLPQGHFRKRKDGPREYAGFASRAFSAYRKTDLGGHIFRIPDFETPPDGPWGPQSVRPRLGTSRRTSGGAKTHGVVSHNLKTDLGVAKRGRPVSQLLQMELGGVQKPLGRLVTPSRRTSGYSSGLQPFLYPSRWTSGGTDSLTQDFCTPPDPLPDFPVHRGHRISTYRLPIDNSLSFPCLDGQC